LVELTHVPDLHFRAHGLGEGVGVGAKSTEGKSINYLNYTCIAHMTG